MSYWFSPRPRERVEELFGRDVEVRRLINALESNSWVAVLGPRMAGKTSLAIASSTEFAKKHGYSTVYIDLRNSTTLREATERILRNLPRGVIKKLGAYLSSITIKGLEIRLKPSASASGALEEALRSLKKTVIILDEVQKVREGLPQFLNALSVAFNENPELLIVFSGSYAGLVKKLFSQTYSEGLYARQPIEITLNPWERDVAEEFLRKGLDECGVKISEKELEDVLWELGTLPGWLSSYGLRRCLGDEHVKALNRVNESAVKEAKRELENILEGRSPNAPMVIKLLSYGATWSELERTGISKRALHTLLDALINDLYVVSKSAIGNRVVYRFTEPSYRKAALLVGQR
ncbi:ATPase [Thermococcus celericrescens]|uniref:ATPase n=1 Tax=Thermococcus celericrescens TaxID=227598 RepID=A0A117ISS4_9EURY|nr:ATP-binding protein [Thermococcus celericrescens]KUH32067.1 ATPase [Thermococcus celericrescens]